MHISVLLQEAVDSLNLKEDSVIVDATLGYAGHSSAVLKRIKRGFLFAYDQDQEAIDFAKTKLHSISSNFKIIKSNFAFMKDTLNQLGVTEVDGVLFDLGVSSPQLDERERGFSYHQDAKLDMRMDQSQSFSAYELVNNYTTEELTTIFYRYGESKFARNIAKKIVEARSIKKIETTLELVEIIKSAVPMKFRIDKHPARQIFQAIRIEVNHELEVLEKGLADALELIKVGGRVSVITFHSLEDRIVKNKFKELTEVDETVKGLPNIPSEYLPKYRLVNKKVIEPSKEELENNSRARSSKLRVIERIR